MKKILNIFITTPQKIITYSKNHKIASLIIAIIIIGGGYLGYRAIKPSNTNASYVLGVVEKTTIVASVSASGQVSTVNEIDIKSKASGDITWVGIKAGDTVRAGQALAYIDATTAKQNIADAEASLASAKLQYKKDSAQAPIDYEKSAETLEDSKKELTSIYNNSYNTISNTYLDLPTAVTGMQNILYSKSLGDKNSSQWNIDVFRDITNQYNNTGSTSTIIIFIDTVEKDYKTARAKYDKAILDFKNLTRYSATSDLEKLLSTSIDTTTAIAQALQSELNLLDAIIDDATIRSVTINPTINTMRATAITYLSTTNNNLSALLNQQKTLDSTKKAIRDNERNIEIYKIGNDSGNNPISLQSSAQSIANQERNLQELKNNLSYYTITAPFSGIIASTNLKKFDTVSNGASTATLITTQKIAQLSLNEVDATKINLGNKATITFDAIEDLSLTGEVVEIDAVGTVSQGVVSYKVKIEFDSQDKRIKSGMTVNSSIQTDVRRDVLAVPSGAIKTQNGISFIQVFNPALPKTDGNSGVTSATPPQQVEIKVGISDDTKIEVLSGLEEGEQIVVRTISGAANTTAPTNIRGGGIGVPGIRL